MRRQWRMATCIVLSLEKCGGNSLFSALQYHFEDRKALLKQPREFLSIFESQPVSVRSQPRTRIPFSISVSLGAQHPYFDHIQHGAVAQWRHGAREAQQRTHEFDFELRVLIGVHSCICIPSQFTQFIR